MTVAHDTLRLRPFELPHVSGRAIRYLRRRPAWNTNRQAVLLLFALPMTFPLTGL